MEICLQLQFLNSLIEHHVLIALTINDHLVDFINNHTSGVNYIGSQPVFKITLSRKQDSCEQLKSHGLCHPTRHHLSRYHHIQSLLFFQPLPSLIFQSKDFYIFD